MKTSINIYFTPIHLHVLDTVTHTHNVRRTKPKLRLWHFIPSCMMFVYCSINKIPLTAFVTMYCKSMWDNWNFSFWKFIVLDFYRKKQCNVQWKQFNEWRKLLYFLTTCLKWMKVTPLFFYMKSSHLNVTFGRLLWLIVTQYFFAHVV